MQQQYNATESHDLVLNDVIVPFENFVETKHKPQPNGWILHLGCGLCFVSTKFSNGTITSFNTKS
jgi:hypothetical protein